MTKRTIKPAATNAAPKPVAPAAESRTLKPHELLLSASIQSAIGVDSWSKFAGAVDLADLVKELREQVKDVADGNMRPVEAMLYGQALALQTMFTSLSRRAATQEHLKPFQANLALALKAQAQGRATLEALAEIKNPRPVAFVKQANISHGHQQVNNGSTPNGAVRAGERAHASENPSQQSKLLEAAHGNHLDTGAPSKAGGADPYMEAVGAGHGAAHD